MDSSIIYILTTHAKERYVERVKGITDKTKAINFANTHSTMIIEHVNKLCKYGNEVYNGWLRKYGETRVIISGNWIVILSSTENKVLTVWEKRLGLDEGFEKKYIDKMIEKINILKDERETISQSIVEQKDKIEETICENKIKIEEYKNILSSLEDTNDSLYAVKENLTIGLKEKENEISDTVFILLHG